MLNYNNINYARERLLGTIVRAKNKAVQIDDLHRDLAVITYLVEPLTKEIKTKDIDITPVPLGYVNQGGVCTYLVRASFRKWKQGLTKNILRSLCGHNPNDILWKSLGETIEGSFPPFKECLSAVNHGIDMAFSRDFAIYRDGKIWYKGEFHVANVVNDNYEILPRCQWVEECLEIAIG